MAGTSFSFAELRALWLNAGGSAAWADTMAAVALAESSGCRYALAGPSDVRPVKVCTYRRTTTENSVGLWQINVMAHPQYVANSLFDPVNNAGAAVAILGHGSPGAWSTYTSGAYRAYLPGHVSAQPPPKHAVPRTQFPSPAGLTGPVGQTKVSVTEAWEHLTYAIGRTMPTQSQRTRDILKRFPGAVRVGPMTPTGLRGPVGH
jgi:hypothetical protein